MRILPPNRIPTELWTGEALQMPEMLKTHYLVELGRLGLMEQANNDDRGGIYGDASEVETHRHFAQRFAAGFSRVQFALLAPYDDPKFETVNNGLLSRFSVGKVALLDIPCGTGVLACSLVTTLVELRKQNILPRLPLEITLCAGDFSQCALDIYKAMVNHLKPLAEKQGIILTFDMQLWDAIRLDNTADMMEKWLASAPDAHEYVVAVTDFSAAMKKDVLLAEFKECVKEIKIRLRKKRYTFIWIEPSRTTDGPTFLRKIRQFVAGLIWPDGKWSEDEMGFRSNYEYMHPVKDIPIKGGVAVEMYERIGH